MARTAPAPNIPPIPGMCPGVAVAGGGGDGGGGGGGAGKKGKGKKGKGTKKGKKGASGGKKSGKKGKGADKGKECKKGGCGNPHSAKSKGDPIDVVTGVMSTLPLIDVDLPGPLPLLFSRRYSSDLHDRDIGFGHGWTHDLAWQIEVRRREIIIHDAEGGQHLVETIPAEGETVPAPNGWQLHRETWGFVLDLDDGLFHAFSVYEAATHRYLLTAVEDRSHNRTALTYDDGRLVEIVDSVGRRVHFELHRQSRRTRSIVVAPGGNVSARTAAELDFDSAGDLIATRDAGGHVTRYVYREHLLEQLVNRANVVFRFRYDALDRCVETWGEQSQGGDPSIDPDAPALLADGKTVARGMHHVRIDFVTDGYTEVADSTSIERYDGDPGGAIEQSAVGGNVAHIDYTPDGHVLRVSNGNGATTVFTRDPRGRMLTSTDPIGRVNRATYDSMGNVVEFVDPRGGVTLDVFDWRGRPVSHTDPDGAITLYAHDARGLLVEEVDPTAAVTRVSYDGAGNAVEISTPNGQTLRRTYDPFGNVTSETDGKGNVTTYGYDANDRRTSVQAPDGASTFYEYDGEGRLLRQTDSDGRSVEITYGVTDDPHVIRDQLGNNTVCFYGREGQLTRIVTPNGGIYRRRWDPSGNMIWEQFADGREFHYKYDPASQLIAVTLPDGRLVGFQYDPAGQLVAKTLADGTEELYLFDGLGDIQSMVRGPLSIEFDRDPVGRVIGERQGWNGEVFSISTVYDPSGEEVERRSSLGHTERVQRDRGGNAIERQLGSTRILQKFDANDRQVEMTAPGIGRIASTYDVSGYLTERAAIDTAGDRLASRRFVHDTKGSIRTIFDSLRGRTDFEHDLAGKLLAVLPQGAIQTEYRWDPDDNIRVVGESRVYVVGDVLEEQRDTKFEWTADRRLSRRIRAVGSDVEITDYEWDGDGRLGAVIGAEGNRTEFIYDPWGRRINKRTIRADGSESSVRFVWDGDELLHEVAANDDGTPRIRTYLFDDDMVTPLAHYDQDSEQSLRLYVTDQIGTPVRLLDRSGVSEVEIGPFGDSRSDETPLRFVGQYADEETGLVYNRFRYYDPVQARFISADPSGIDGGLNVFAAPWDPYTLGDPDGLRFTDKTKAKAVEKARGPDGKVHCQAEGCGKVVVKGKKSVSKTLPNGKPNPAFKKPPPNEMQFDHKKPRAKGGSDSVRNCQVMCRKCNRGKSDKY